jgi:hypothetical protein
MSETAFWMSYMRRAKVEKSEEIEGMCGANHDSEIERRDRKNGD